MDRILEIGVCEEKSYSILTLSGLRMVFHKRCRAAEICWFCFAHRFVGEMASIDMKVNALD